MLAAIRAAIGGDGNTPADPVTPAPGPVTPVTDPVTPPASNTFLWKPASDNDGCLVILLPASVNASGVTVNGEAHKAYTGRANGNRQHYRFRKPGASYGVNVAVVAKLTAGGVKTWTVPNGSARWETH